MPRPLVVLDVVGLTHEMLGPGHAEHRPTGARRLRAARWERCYPRVTCSAQATLLTGLLPRDHGIVANGWYFRDLSEIWLAAVEPAHPG